MAENTFKIVVGNTTLESSVELNGQPLKGVRRVKFVLDALQPNMSFLSLEIYGEALVEGEFKEKLILSAEGAGKVG